VHQSVADIDVGALGPVRSEQIVPDQRRRSSCRCNRTRCFPQGGQIQRVARARAASELIAVVTTVAVVPDTRAKTTANRMKSLHMMIPHFRCALYARRWRRDL
jgi:hypothetical protein